MLQKTGTSFWSFQPEPRSDAARLQWIYDTAPAAGAAAGGDLHRAVDLLLAAAQACDWGRCCPAYNWFALPQGDLPSWQLAHLEPDPDVVGGQRLVMVPFGRFTSGLASFRAALAAGVVRPAAPSYFAELVRLYHAAPRSSGPLLRLAPAPVEKSPAGKTSPAR